MNYKVVLLFAFIFISAFHSFAQLESINAIADKDIICEGDTIQLNVQYLQTGNNTLTFEWDNAETLTNNSIVNPRGFPLISTIYFVTVTDVDHALVFRDSIEIVVVPKPEVNAGNDGIVCENQEFKVSNAFTNNSIEFHWSHNGQGILLDTNSYTPIYFPAEGEIGTVNIMLTTGGILYCDDITDSLQLTIAELPKVELNISADTICNNENFVFSEPPTISHVQNFSWTHNGQGTLINTHTLTPEYVPDEFESGKVRIILIGNGTASCTQVYDTLNLFLGTSPSIQIAQKELAGCYGNSLTIDGVVISNASQVDWEHNGEGVLEDVDTNNPVYIPKLGETGTIEVVITAHGSNNCSPTTDTLYIEVSEPQQTLLPHDTSVCSNENLVLSVPEGLTYLWSTGETSSSIEVNPKIDTFYSVQTTNSVGCVLVDTIHVTVHDMEIEYTNDALICEGEEVTIAVVYSDDHIYSWDTGETSSAITVSPVSETSYFVTVTNSNGCVADAEIVVSVNESPFFDIEKVDGERIIEVYPSNYSDYTFLDASGNVLQSGFSNTFAYSGEFEANDTIIVRTSNDLGCSVEDMYFVEREERGLIPGFEVNAFSPNGDGINDVFLNGQKIVVIDRSDKILFDGNTGWDGQSNGKDMPAGTYYFVAYDTTGEVIYKGSVTIVRD